LKLCRLSLEFEESVRQAVTSQAGGSIRVIWISFLVLVQGRTLRPVLGMITLEDCVAFCGLTEEEVLAIAEHEHMPEIAAAAFAEYLTNQEHGTEKIRDMIVDDIRAAQAHDDKEHVLTLLHVLHHFLRTHPEARPEQHPWSDRF
jgi:hypothetical protein